MNAAGLFVYGTLKHNESNHRLIERYVRSVVRDCYIWGALHDLGKYPAMVTPGVQKIRGELLIAESLDELLRATDAIEGTEYERILVEVYLEGNADPAQRAWAYRFAGDITGLQRLEGEWRGSSRISTAASSEET